MRRWGSIDTPADPTYAGAAVDIRLQYVNVDQLKLHVAQAGPAGGPLLILLHGFPEFWYGWRNQIPYLAERGFRVWAPDQRGYNVSDKPQGMAAYNIDALAADVVGLIDAAGQEKATIIGHDWGAAVAWWLARRYPERVERLVVLNQAHGSVFRRALRDDPEQRRKSRYMAFFQVPWLPEKFFSLGDHALLLRWLRKSARPAAWGGEALVEYRRAWSQPGAMTGMLNWYRAIRRVLPATRAPRQVTVPVLIIWGKGDPFLGWELAEPSLEYCDNGRVIYVENATHWLHHERPERINELLDAFTNKN